MAGRKKGSSNASPEQVHEALETLARVGNASEAARQLKMSDRTLRHWRDEHSDAFAKICQAFAREREDVIRAASIQSAEELAETIRELRREARKAVQASDRIAAHRALVKTLEVADRLSRLDAGRPTAIAETRSREELLDESAKHAAWLRAHGYLPATTDDTGEVRQ